jgi:hypothetical protein
MIPLPEPGHKYVSGADPAEGNPTRDDSALCVLDADRSSGRGGRRRAGQSDGIVEFAVGEESGVTGDCRAVELQLDLAVEIDAQGVIVAVIHWVPLSFRQE